ncbi:MAG TPA: ATP-binding cassette domain-containing protein [Firmicutes bacterium]|nr:ATP-binding cassette domain-containing protein [Candidatus Fermentithermobacillaceae bacterium]
MARAIVTRGLRKEFPYLNPSPNMSTSDQWLEYLLSLITGKNATGMGVEKRRTVAVESLDLEVEEGEFFGLLGPNGAGKSTSIKMLATILAPTAGTATINGYDLVRDWRAVRASINVVHSGGWLGFDHELSIRWNLQAWARIYGLSKKEAARRTQEVLDIVGLSDKAEETSGTLSSGQRQRLALAKGFLMEAPILLCDEPTVGLDPNSAAAVRSFIKDDVNRKRGITVLLTTHYMQEADQLCDRVAIMDKGRIVACDTPDRLKASVQAKAILMEVRNFRIEMLFDFKKEHGQWLVTEKLDQNGNGSLRVLCSPREAESTITTAVEACGGQVVGWSRDDISLEDVFIVLTGRRLAA